MTHSPRSRAVRPSVDSIDAEKLGKLIASVARDASAATLEFKAAKKLLLRDLCLLFGAGSYKHGRETLLQLLLAQDEEDRTHDACAALDDLFARLKKGELVDLRLDLNDLSRAVEARDGGSS